ncbi:MAG: GPW/gp25 family protein [Nitrososphaerota archaeon]|nr:GPW/gp25 family protein [Nitrososphaerota archaeon]
MSEGKGVLGKDLKLVETQTGADLALSPSGDLDLVSDEMNLGQAIVHRIRTRSGELTEIGHRRYGSRLYDLIGEPNNETTRERIKVIIREALSHEPRVKEILSLQVTPMEGRAEAVRIELSVSAIGGEVPLNIVLPFYLEVA